MSYAAAALSAAKLASAKNISPENAWESAVRDECPDSINNQEKGCPKNTFLGLCELGCIKGIPAGVYTRSESNKIYGLIAVLILTINKKRSFTPGELWQIVLQQVKADPEKQHNSQMNVVLSLWESGLIVI